MDPGTRVGACEDEFEEREEGVHGVLADVGPRVVAEREPWSHIQNGPVHDRHQEREVDDCAI